MHESNEAERDCETMDQKTMNHRYQSEEEEEDVDGSYSCCWHDRVIDYWPYLR